jgi:hypothetical protein
VLTVDGLERGGIATITLVHFDQGIEQSATDGGKKEGQTPSSQDSDSTGNGVNPSSFVDNLDTGRPG